MFNFSFYSRISKNVSKIPHSISAHLMFEVENGNKGVFTCELAHLYEVKWGKEAFPCSSEQGPPLHMVSQHVKLTEPTRIWRAWKGFNHTTLFQSAEHQSESTKKTQTNKRLWNRKFRLTMKAVCTAGEKNQQKKQQKKNTLHSGIQYSTQSAQLYAQLYASVSG